MIPKIYSVEQAAEILSVNASTVRAWLRGKQLAGIKLGGYIWRIKEDALKKFIEEGYPKIMPKTKKRNRIRVDPSNDSYVAVIHPNDRVPDSAEFLIMRKIEGNLVAIMMGEEMMIVDMDDIKKACDMLEQSPELMPEKQAVGE